MTDLTSSRFSVFEQILRSPATQFNLPADLESELLLKGIVVKLQQDASPEAVNILEIAGTSCPIDTVRSLALSALDILAFTKNSAALDALFHLAIEQNQSDAREIILKREFQAAQPEQQAVFLLLAGQKERYLQTDPDLGMLTRFYLKDAGEVVQQYIIASAEKMGLKSWVTLINAAQNSTLETNQHLLDRYASFTPEERRLVLWLFEKLAGQGQIPAQEVLCELFLRYEELEAREFAVHNGFAPKEAIPRALFYFLTEQWTIYETYDFDHHLLVAAYETADNALRKRILDLSRQSGQMEWFQDLSGANRMRWLRDLSDADWENTIRLLSGADRWLELWRLAQLASPSWSSQILRMLVEKGISLPHVGDTTQLVHLAELAQEAIANPLTIHPLRSFSIPTMDDLSSMAMSPDGNWLAFGGSSNAIHIWNVADYPKPRPILYGAVAQTRTLAFSPDGEYLASSVGDHSLRIYRWEDSKAVKTLEGHQGLVRSLAIAPDSRFLYSASFDGSVRAWRFPFGPEVKVISTSEGEVFGLAVSPDGNTLISAGADRSLQVFQLPEGNKIREMQGHLATVTNLAAAPTTQFVASYSRDRTIRVWNYTSGREIQNIEYQPDVVTGLYIHPNEQVLVSAGYKGHIHLWNLSTGRPLFELDKHKRAVIGLALSPDGDTLVSASADGSVTLWNLNIFLLSRQPVETMQLDQINIIQQKLNQQNLTPAEKKWLEFTIELLRWKQRFDVEIEGPKIISISDFDIQL